MATQQDEMTIEEGIEYLRAIIEAIEGKRGIKERTHVISNPDNPETMSILTKHQAEFVKIAKWAEKNKDWGSMWSGLGRLADLELSINVSIGGKGQENVIRLVGALSETKLLSGLTQLPSRKE